MNAQQLKNAILQEAIEGRLVPQDPNDEPASVLLARIRKEKEQLVKEGKLKKKDLEVKPISEDEIPFEIPESWEWVRLSSLSSAIHYGYTASAAPTGNAKLLRITDIQNDKVDWKSVPYCTTKEKELDSYQLKNRDILIARTGGTIGKTYIVKHLEEIAVFASYLIRAIPLEEVNEEFLKLFMMTPCYWKQLTDASSGTGQPNVNGQSLSNLILPIPPKEEQKRILSKYEELLPKVEEYGKAQDALNKLNAELPERLKKSILQEAIEGRLVPQDPNDEPASVLLAKIRKEKEQLVKEGKLKKKELIETPISEEETPFDIPDSWEWVRFGTITFNRDSERVPLSVDERSKLKKIYDYYGASGVIDKVDKYLFDKPLLLIGEDGANLINRSTPIAFIAKGKFWVNNHAHVLDYINEDLMQYICWYINAISLVDYITGTAQPKMNQEKMNSILVALPPLAEQKRIVVRIEELLKVIDKL